MTTNWTGGGCGSKKKPVVTSRIDWKTRFAEIKEAQKAYWESPEGIAEFAASAERDRESSRILNERLEAERLENEKQLALRAKFDELRDVKVGTVISGQSYRVTLSEHKDGKRLSACVLLRVEGPEPHYELARTGKAGLRVFLNSEAIKTLGNEFAPEFLALDEMIQDQKARASRPIEDLHMDFVMMHERVWKPEISIDCFKDIRIVARSEKSAIGAFVMEKP